MAEYIFQIVGDCFDDKYISRADCARANKSRYTVNKSRSLAAPKLSRSLKHRASFSRGRTSDLMEIYKFLPFELKVVRNIRFWPATCRKMLYARIFEQMSFISRSCSVCVLLKKFICQYAYCLFASFFFQENQILRENKVSLLPVFQY